MRRVEVRCERLAWSVPSPSTHPLGAAFPPSRAASTMTMEDQGSRVKLLVGRQKHQTIGTTSPITGVLAHAKR